MTEDTREASPLLGAKAFEEESVFTPESLVENARQQKGLPEEPVPEVCVLDPDGDIVRQLVATGEAYKDPAWPGYHTDLYRFERNDREYGIVGCAVGASFAVLVAEQLFAAGCQFLVSVTSWARSSERTIRRTSYSSNEPSATRGRAITTGLQNGTRPSGLISATEWKPNVDRCPGRCTLERRGPRTHRFAKRRQQSTAHGRKGFLPSRWKPLRSIPSPGSDPGQSSVSRT